MWWVMKMLKAPSDWDGIINSWITTDTFETEEIRKDSRAVGFNLKN